MFAIIGIVVVFGSVIGGFLMEKGHHGCFFSRPNC
jgi:flagellar motor component MotA